ncbi:MAG: phosphoribosylanthranilate isomerase [Xanthomonadales bacterium]|nr:phosphoribosylanthranilate isomerase [Xanthomonadales bacterium]
MCRAEDIDCAVSLGVDAVGLIMVAGSRRELDTGRAAILRRRVPPLVASVLLISDPDSGWLDEVCAEVRPDLLQFHGSESVEQCVRAGLPYLKAVPMASVEVARHMFREHGPHAAGWVLDGHVAGGQGGSGKRFDWAAAPRLERPVLLAGGLHADNVVEAIRTVRPFAVDVASGIETSPGVKDAASMRRFLRAVREVDNHLEPEEEPS